MARLFGPMLPQRLIHPKRGRHGVHIPPYPYWVVDVYKDIDASPVYAKSPALRRRIQEEVDLVLQGESGDPILSAFARQLCRQNHLIV